MKTLLAIVLVCCAIPAFADGVPDPCSLLLPSELAELGIPADAAPAKDSKGNGQLLSCSYGEPGSPPRLASAPSATVMVAAAGQDRLRELKALFAKAVSENSASALQERGEFYLGSVMCKVQVLSGREVSHCLGAARENVVALSIFRSATGDKPSYPEVQLRLETELASRVQERGG